MSFQEYRCLKTSTDARQVALAEPEAALGFWRTALMNIFSLPYINYPVEVIFVGMGQICVLCLDKVNHYLHILHKFDYSIWMLEGHIVLSNIAFYFYRINL